MSTQKRGPTYTSFAGMHRVNDIVEISVPNGDEYKGVVGADGWVLLVRKDLIIALHGSNVRLLRLLAGYSRKRKQTK